MSTNASGLSLGHRAHFSNHRYPRARRYIPVTTPNLFGSTADQDQLFCCATSMASPTTLLERHFDHGQRVLTYGWHFTVQPVIDLDRVTPASDGCPTPEVRGQPSLAASPLAGQATSSLIDKG
jgi:hypothetical protein